MPASGPHHSVEYTVIAAYLVLMIVIGFLFRNFNKTTSDYFRGGSQATWWMVGMSAFMSGISAVTFTGNGGAAFDAGWSVLALYLGSVVGLLIQALFLAPWFRQMRATTFPEVVRSRFGPATQQVYACLQLVTFTAYAALWLFGLALFGSSTFGLPIDLMIPLLGVVVLFYSTTGGKWAVMAADFIQGVVMMAVTILLSVLCLVKVGGIGGLLHLISESGNQGRFAFFKAPGAFPDNAYTWQWALAGFLIQVVVNCSANNAAKYFAVKDGREARRAALLSAVLMLAGVAFWFLPPITARLLFESEVLQSGMPKPSEAAFAIISTHLLPIGLIGMMVVAMFSATLSSMDVGLNGNAAIVLRDVLPALCHFLRRPLPPEKKQLLLSRLSTIGFGILIISLATYLSKQKELGIFELVINFSALVTIPITVPMVLCLFVRRVPSWAALFAIGGALIPGIISLLQPGAWSFQERTFWTTAAGAAAFLFTRLFWKTAPAEYRREVDLFFEQMHRPVDYGNEVGVSSDGRQLRMMGGLSLAVAGFVALLLFVPNPMAGRVCIATLSGAIAAVGACLLFAGFSKRNGDLPDGPIDIGRASHQDANLAMLRSTGENPSTSAASVP